MSLLDSLFQLLGPQLEGVELRRAWGPGWGSRLVRGPVVSGEVLSARWAGQSQETQVRLTVFAPEASQRREIAEALEAAVRQCGSAAPAAWSCAGKGSGRTAKPAWAACRCG